MKLEGRFRPNLASNPAVLSYPPTLHKCLPLPSKTLYPWWGSRVELNKGQGRSAVTPGLPLPITNLIPSYWHPRQAAWTTIHDGDVATTIGCQTHSRRPIHALCMAPHCVGHCQ